MHSSEKWEAIFDPFNLFDSLESLCGLGTQVCALTYFSFFELFFSMPLYVESFRKALFALRETTLKNPLFDHVK